MSDVVVAGLLLVATSTARLVWIDSTVRLVGRAGGARPGSKVLTLIHVMIAGAGHIDHADMLRAGSTGGVLRPSGDGADDIGTFLRAYTFSEGRQLEKVTAKMIARAWALGVGPGVNLLVIDVDSTIGEVTVRSSRAPATASKTFGQHPILASRADTGEVLHTRLRKGQANTVDALHRHHAVVELAISCQAASSCRRLRHIAPAPLPRGRTGPADGYSCAMHRLFFSCGLTLLLLTAGCASDGSSSTTESAGNPAASDPSGSAADEDNSSPIADALGLPFDPILGYRGSPAEGDEAYRQIYLQREQMIAECMAQQGFEYVAYVPPDVSGSVAADEDIPAYSRDWYGKYGFLITTTAFEQSAVSPNLVGRPDNPFAQGNPNETIQASLTPSESQAYFRALVGDDTNSEGQDGEVGGCSGVAQTESAFGRMSAFLSEYERQVNDLQAAVELDQRMVDFNDEVAACAADRGYTYAGEAELRESNPWQASLDEIGENLQPATAQFTPEEVEAMTPEQQQKMLQPGFSPLTEEQRETLRELQAEEQELALVVFDCGGLGQEARDLYDEIVLGLQAEFLANNPELS